MLYNSLYLLGIDINRITTNMELELIDDYLFDHRKLDTVTFD